MATITDLADAVVAELNSIQWGLVFVAQRSYRPRFETADLASLQVTVVPRSLTIEAADRGQDVYDYKIDVAVQKRLDGESATEIDPLLGLVEEIAQYFRLRHPAVMTDAVCVKVDNEPVYAVEHLDELRCFTSIITLTFRMLQ